MLGERGRRSLEPNNTIGKIVDPFQNISSSAFPKKSDVFISADDKTVTLMHENTNFMKAESLEPAWSFKK
jgi:hypothetical protein